MELAAKDEVAYQVCRARKEKVVSLIHQHLGLASVAEVSDIPGKGLFKLPLIASMADRRELELIETRRVGQDVRLTMKVKSEK